MIAPARLAGSSSPVKHAAKPWIMLLVPGCIEPETASTFLNQQPDPRSCVNPGGSGWLVAGAHARPQAADAGAGGAGQHDGPDRLGAAGQGWGVSSSGCGGVGAVTTARLSRRGRVKGEGWRNGRETGSGKPASRQALQARGPELDLIHGLPSGPAACEPHQRPHTCQHPTTGHTAPEDFSCSSRGVHTCRKVLVFTAH